jgi:hypothetical protein
MKRETKRALAEMFIGIGIMLTVAWIVGFWLNDPRPAWALIARGLTIPAMVIGVLLSAERVTER